MKKVFDASKSEWEAKGQDYETRIAKITKELDTINTWKKKYAFGVRSAAKTWQLATVVHKLETANRLREKAEDEVKHLQEAEESRISRKPASRATLCITNDEYTLAEPKSRRATISIPRPQRMSSYNESEGGSCFSSELSDNQAPSMIYSSNVVYESTQEPVTHKPTVKKSKRQSNRMTKAGRDSRYSTHRYMLVDINKQIASISKKLGSYKEILTHDTEGEHHVEKSGRSCHGNCIWDNFKTEVRRINKEHRELLEKKRQIVA